MHVSIRIGEVVDFDDPVTDKAILVHQGSGISKLGPVCPPPLVRRASSAALACLTRTKSERIP